MKKIILSLLLAIIWSAGSYGATRSEINTIEAAEKVRYLSQKLAKYYLYLYIHPNDSYARQNIDNMIMELDNSFETIASSSNDTYTQDLLTYLRYNKNDIEELLKKKITKQSALLMLDYSEVMLEGGQSIVKVHSYDFSKEEAMLMNIKRDEYLAERLGKFYMAYGLGKLSDENLQKIQKSQIALNKGIKIIQQYTYPKNLQDKKSDLLLFWASNKHIMSQASNNFTPHIMNISNEYFEHLLAQFSLYHSKIQ